jgi:error-prone DNA polymerase
MRHDPWVGYAELHCHSNFSFLDGASHPEELVAEAARLGLEALALTDHDGFYGVVRFAEAARKAGLASIFGAELSLGLSKSQAGINDPEGNHLVVLARSPAGYAKLGCLLAAAHLAGGSKGRPVYTESELSRWAGNDWAILTGCRKGAVPSAIAAGNTDEARSQLQYLAAMFGADNVFVELWDHGLPRDSVRNDMLFGLAQQLGLPVVATNNVHYATTADYRLATALSAVRSRSSLDASSGWLPPTGAAHIRSGYEQSLRFSRYKGSLETAAELGDDCAFDLKLVAPRLPDFPLPAGHDEASYLRQLAYEGAERRYGPRHNERVNGAWAQLDRELGLIEVLEFPGYFLVVWDIVEFCKRSDILCQGRGSAANSAVCYALGVTNVDAVSFDLLFERFLSPDRQGPPDIDIDIESGRREEVIQYVYERHGREYTAQVANVITYRQRSAVRDMSKAFGYSPGQQDAWAKQLERGESLTSADADHAIPTQVVELADQVVGYPRHLGIHSGGMVICDRPIAEVCPIEWARRDNRSVLQWDKEDCANAGLVKFDLLGLGMMSALHKAMDMVKEHFGEEIDLAHLPQEDEVYDMLGRADAIGLFQVESRAQLATLPRLRPRCFYDLAIEVALIRPGPIQGNAVHPLIRRHNGQEEITYLHPLLEPALRRTKGVPLFQEQLMHMAIDVAGFTAAEADMLRQAISSKRSVERMEEMKTRLFAGMAKNGITGRTADAIYESMKGFAHFGFAESHSISFALLVYASAYIKLHWPQAYLAALLNSQPMGFWSPQSLVADAQRHNVVVHGPDINESRAGARVCADRSVRLGLEYVRSIDSKTAARLESAQPFSSVEDIVQRCGLNLAQVEALATAGALQGFGIDRRQSLWVAGAAAQSRPGRLPGVVSNAPPPDFEPMNALEETAADLWSTGVSTKHSPIEFLRPELDQLGVWSAEGLGGAKHGQRVKVAGIVTHRQRPETASGVTFVNLEDETGHVNVVCSVGVWKRYRRQTRAPALVITGKLERVDGVMNVVATKIESLAMPQKMTTHSRSWC